MNIHKTYFLFALIATVAVAGSASAYAQSQPCAGCGGDPWEQAEEALLSELPISVWLDKAHYNMGEVLVVQGHVAHVTFDYPVMVQVRDQMSNLVAVDQVVVNPDGTFETMLSSASWNVPGLYSLAVQYGEPHKNNKAQFTLSDVVVDPGCGISAISLEDTCIAYAMDGGSIIDARLSPDTGSVILDVSTHDSGHLAIEFPEEIVTDIFMVLVDGEESNDVHIQGQSVEVWLLPGSEKVEILAMHVVPEFGFVAALVLAAAIISVVALSSRSRLSMIPRF